MSQTIDLVFKKNVKLPRPPNFIEVDGQWVSTADFTEEQLRDIARAWTEALVVSSKNKKLLGQKK